VTGSQRTVITALGRFSNLLVIAKSATFPFKGSNAAPAEIGRLLDARYLLDCRPARKFEMMVNGVELHDRMPVVLVP